MSIKNYYNILGLNENASPSELKKTYRRLAMKYHPDRNPGNKKAEEKFKEIKHAYEYIVNKNNTKTDEDNNNNNSNNFTYTYTNMDNNFDDLFSEFFGDSEYESTDQFEQSFSKTNNTSDSDFNMDNDVVEKVEIDIHDAAKGIKYSCYIPIWKQCSICHGNKYIQKSKKGLCFKCKGSGFVKIINAFLSIKQTCPECNGYGRCTSSICINCNGLGKIKHREYISIDIPKGVLDGHKIKVPNKGELYNTTLDLYGNYYFEIYIKKNSYYNIDVDLNIHYNLKVFFIDILLGTSLIVKTLYKQLKIYLKQCYDINKSYVIKNEGYYISKTKSYSNFIIHIIPYFPKYLNNYQKKYLHLLRSSFPLGKK